MGKQSLLGLRLNDEMWAMLDGLVAQQNEELAGMGLAARVGAQDVLRQLIHNAHVAGGVRALAGMIALGKKASAPIERPLPEPESIDSEIEYNLAAAEPTPKKGPRKRPEPPPVAKVDPPPPTSARPIDLTISSTPPPPAPTVTSDEALAEIGLADQPPAAPAPNPPTEDDEIAAMLDSV